MYYEKFRLKFYKIWRRKLTLLTVTLMKKNREWGAIHADEFLFRSPSVHQEVDCLKYKNKKDSQPY